MNSRVVVLAVVALLAAAVPNTGYAADSARAKALYKEGKTNFELGKFEAAIKAWEDGYKESSNPEFLYNIGQAYRLAGDAAKALFFYKSYLRQSSRAKNAAEVEEKITQLQAQLDAAAVAATIPAPITAESAPVAPTAPAEADVSARAEAPVPLGLAGPIDLGVGVGLDSWLGGTGDRGGASLAVNLTAGVTFGAADSATRFRLGGKLGFASFDDRPGGASFWSLLVVPGVVHAINERWWLGGEVGLGFAAVGGLAPGSVLIDPTIIEVNGALGRFEFRPAAQLAYRLSRGTALFFAPALAVDAGRDKVFPDAVVRLELLIGASFHLGQTETM